MASPIINHFNTSPKKTEDFRLPPAGEDIWGIKAIDGEIVTDSFLAKARVENGNTVSDTERDILKMTVVNRYLDAPPALAFIHNFGLV